MTFNKTKKSFNFSSVVDLFTVILYKLRKVNNLDLPPEKSNKDTLTCD